MDPSYSCSTVLLGRHAFGSLLTQCLACADRSYSDDLEGEWVYFVHPCCVTCTVRNIAIELQGFNSNSRVTEPNGYTSMNLESLLYLMSDRGSFPCRAYVQREQAVFTSAEKLLHPPPMITLPARTLLSVCGSHCYLFSLLQGESCHPVSYKPLRGLVAILWSLSALDPAYIREDLSILELSKPPVKLNSSCPDGMSLRRFWDTK